MKNLSRVNILLIGFLSIFILLLISSCRKDTTTTTVRLPGGQYGQKISNVQYGSNKDWQGNNVNLLMDVYIPEKQSSGQKFPLVFFVHGGSFVGGDKSNGNAVDFMTDFQKQGFVGVSINYRIGWNTGSGTCDGDTTQCKEAVYRAIQDARAALRFLVANADRFSIDVNNIFLSGNSAGAVIVLNSSFITQEVADAVIPGVSAKLGLLDNADNDIRASYHVKAIASVAGCLSSPELITAENALPVIFFQGEQDEVIPFNEGTAFNCPNNLHIYGSLPLYNRLQALGENAVLHADPNGTHGNTVFTEPFAQQNEACFFNSLMNGNGQDGSFQGSQSSCK